MIKNMDVQIEKCVYNALKGCLHCDMKASCKNVGDLLCQSSQLTAKQGRLELIVTDKAVLGRNL